MQLTKLIVFLTLINIAIDIDQPLALDFHNIDDTSTSTELATESEPEPKKSLLDMLFGAFTKQQDTENEPHLEDALRSEPDTLQPGTIANIVENLEGDFQNTSNLTIINTRTGRVHKASMKVGEIYEFEKIAIKNLSCWSKFEKTILPESRSLIEMYDISKKPEISKIFYGWLLASSQNSSLLENKEYDVVLNSCSNK